MCAYIKCTYKFSLFLHFTLTQNNTKNVEFGSENNFFSPTSKKALSIDIYARTKENRKNFNFVLFSLRSIEKFLGRRGRNEANAFDKQRNTLGIYGIKLYRN
jgi:hypothetical protein